MYEDRVFVGWVIWEPNVPLNTLHHFTILSEDVGKSAAFFKDVLGLSEGFSPEPGFPVRWLYLGGEPVIHIVHPETRDIPEAYDTGCIDHVAFNCTDYAAVKTRIEVNNANHREQTQPEIGVHQVFVECPDGVWIELVFDIEEYNTSQLIHPEKASLDE